MTGMQKLESKTREKSTDILKMSAKTLAVSFVDGADDAFVAILNVLRERMTEAEFIEFCDAL